MSMQLLDALVRFATVGLLLNLVFLATLSRSNLLVVRVGAALLVSISAVLINSSSYAIGDTFRFVLKVLETPNVGLLWWFGLALFKDDFELRPMHWFGMALACALGFSIRMRYFGWSAPISDLHWGYVLAFVLMGHLLWSVLSEAGGDLVNRRRSARFWAVTVFAVSAIAMGVAEITLPHEVQSFIRAAFLLPIAVTGTVWVTTVRVDRLAFVERPRDPSPARASEVDPSNSALVTALDRAMNNERLYLQQGLTVAKLAEFIGVPEHKLRAHINRQTGFRNFSAYINHYRVQAAKAALSDPNRTKDGILGIALDAGFSSLPTFNRVFKSMEGLTPSDFRQTNLSSTKVD
ncbi:MAG: helix-turn-helix transcriptional regulator [Pseudomonadota bacterium]